MKRFICLLLTILLIITACSFNNVAYAAQYEVEGYTYDDLGELELKINEYNALIDAAMNMASAARDLGYEENHEVIRLAKEEYITYTQERNFYRRIYDNLNSRWQLKVDEYLEATQVWTYLKGIGYSNYVCAGILGNIMTEVGGNTLSIQPSLETTEYYGICQWSSYYPDAWGLSLEEQCNFLASTIESEFDEFGRLYKRKTTYDSFLSMTNCSDIALCFAKVYERCNSSSYKSRQDNAIIAYNYYVS